MSRTRSGRESWPMRIGKSTRPSQACPGAARQSCLRSMTTPRTRKRSCWISIVACRAQLARAWSRSFAGLFRLMGSSFLTASQFVQQDPDCQPQRAAEGPIELEDLGFLGIGAWIAEQRRQRVPEDGCNLLQGVEVGVEVSIDVATKPRLIAPDLGGQLRLRDAHRSDPDPDLLAGHIIQGRHTITLSHRAHAILWRSSHRRVSHNNDNRIIPK